MNRLLRQDLDPDPLRQFQRWFAEARVAGVHEPEAMTLATAGEGGAPSARMVLLRGDSPAGLEFFTNYESRKGRELTGNPRAALLFYWHPPGRQVRVEGPVARLTRAESEAYFAERPRESRLGAWASMQGAVIPDRAALDDRVAEAARRFPGEVPVPPYWGGFRLAPHAWEFWQAGESRLHDRFRYLPAPSGAWVIERLSP